MALEQYFQEAYAHHDMVDGEDESSSQKWKSVADDASTVAPDNSSNGCFDCNICLDHARDPVVTLCGHLYCWPCIYKWLHFQSNSSDPEQQQQQPQCPICKANVSHATLVPLYGHGHSSPEVEESNGKGPSCGLEIPSRPPAFGTYALITTATPPSQLNQHQQAATPMFNVGGTMTHPVVGMFGEMVHGSVFGNSSEAGFYGYSNSNQLLMGSSDARLRRQEMKADRSLNRVSIFLFCCFLLCLILF